MENFTGSIKPSSSKKSSSRTSQHETKKSTNSRTLSERKRTGGPILFGDRFYTLGRRGNYATLHLATTRRSTSATVTRKSTPRTSGRKSTPRTSGRKSSPRKSPLKDVTNEETLAERKNTGGLILPRDSLHELGIRGHYIKQILPPNQSDLVTALQINFHKKNVNLEYNKYQGPVNNYMINGKDTTTKSNDDNECFSIFVPHSPNIKTIEINKLKCCPQPNCTLKGPLILKMLIEIAELFQYNIFIKKDKSNIELTNPAKTEVSLPTFNIFLYGESFYNRQGFFSENHESDKLFNDKIRKRPLREIFKTFELNDIIHNLIDLLTVNENTTVAELANKMLPVINTRKYSNKFANALETIVGTLEYKFQYEVKNLFYKK